MAVDGLRIVAEDNFRLVFREAVGSNFTDVRQGPRIKQGGNQLTRAEVVFLDFIISRRV